MACYTQADCTAMGSLQQKTFYMHQPPGGCYGNGTQGSICTECYNSSCAGGYFTQNTCQAEGDNVKVNACVQCTTQCNIGWKLDEATLCRTGKELVNTNCLQCNSNCYRNYFVSQKCPGNSIYDTTVCKACKQCPAYTFMSPPCYGNTDYDSQKCAPCLVVDKCPQRNGVDSLTLINGCNGRQESDTASCILCQIECQSWKLFDSNGMYSPGEKIILISML